jgi:hypothetical protein
MALVAFVHVLEEIGGAIEFALLFRRRIYGRASVVYVNSREVAFFDVLLLVLLVHYAIMAGL